MSALAKDELERRLALACSVAREAGAFARSAFLNRDALQIETKGEQDWVTNVDLEVESLIRSRLAEDYPEDPVIGEEMEGNAGDSGRAWVVDPIDGTTCFLLGLPQWCVALCYVVGGRPVVGVIYAPMTGELFSAASGHGTFLNGKPVHVSGSASIRDGLIAVGINSGAHPERSAKFILDLVKGGGMYLRVGACALALAYVAAGRLLAAFEPLVSPWDDLAGMLLVREAGGRTSEFAAEIGTEKRAVLASVPPLWDELSILMEPVDAQHETVPRWDGTAPS